MKLTWEHRYQKTESGSVECWSTKVTPEFAILIMNKDFGPLSEGSYVVLMNFDGLEWTGCLGSTGHENIFNSIALAKTYCQDFIEKVEASL